MNNIRLIASDFDNLDHWKGTSRDADENERQFGDIHRCPIANALIRQGYTRVSVGTFNFTTQETGELGMEGGFEEVYKVAQKLLKGAEYATIKVTNTPYRTRKH